MSIVLFIVVFISSVAYILGGMIVLIKKNWSQTSVLAIAAMSAGLLLSIAILDLIPETQAELKNSSLFIMLGLIFMYLVSYLSKASKKGKGNNEFDDGSMLGISLGMSLHNFLEGLSIGVSYSISVNLGIMVSFALVLHKIPEGITYAASVLAITQNHKKTVINLLYQGLFMWLGVGMSILLSYFIEINEKALAIPIAIIAGIFLYLGGTALLPMTNKITNRNIPISFVSGVIIYIIFHSISEFLG
ncbi:ZIP family metal transporter [Bacillus sp. ISL-40]|uniref:ZIP family metal transporter n=1 Tax=unclassified Bacillus (in: firmicutes) TaxID=185979 RepID=UPI001BEC4D30|nr:MULTISPECIES: ZIP family metal transporter [unclassified Bacillus (in: firmicutes)]MBT2698565.1 ZIP family metal transporter [Bacillus sp. ISL-40]MBT2720198.1 ZIP family metal transporter [Bacillus sp. ISL-46]MBT2739209.1 ZIP family metal transporter [Bacillus sp. ISL-77]